MKNFIIKLILLLICIASFYFSYKQYTYDLQTTQVTGTIYGKTVEGVLTGKHHRNYQTIYVFALKPDEPRYRNITVNVSFATYSQYNIGERVTFNNIYKKDVDTYFHARPVWIFAVSITIGSLFFILWFGKLIDDNYDVIFEVQRR